MPDSNSSCTSLQQDKAHDVVLCRGLNSSCTSLQQNKAHDTDLCQTQTALNKARDTDISQTLWLLYLSAADQGSCAKQTCGCRLGLLNMWKIIMNVHIEQLMSVVLVCCACRPVLWQLQCSGSACLHREMQMAARLLA